MTETQPHKPQGYTREMREARAAQQAAIDPAAPEGLSAAAEPVERRAITRENRKPFGATTQKLAYPERPGYHRHWFNDHPGRIDGALEAGYAHVRDERTGQNVQRVVGRMDSGNPQTAFLMEIPREWYDDDMEAYEKKNQEVDSAIRRGVVGAEKADPKDASHFYPTAQGRQISLTRSARPGR